MVNTRSSSCPRKAKKLGKCGVNTIPKQKSVSKNNKNSATTKASNKKCFMAMRSCEKMAELESKTSRMQGAYLKLAEDLDDMIIKQGREVKKTFATPTGGFRRPREAGAPESVKWYKLRATAIHKLSKLNREMKTLERQYEKAKKACLSSNPRGNLCATYTTNAHRRHTNANRQAQFKKLLKNVKKQLSPANKKRLLALKRPPTVPSSYANRWRYGVALNMVLAAENNLT